jgi:hypothetical protein
MKVKDNQSLVDLAIQYSGTTTAAFDLALANNISLTDDLTAGQTLISLDKDYGFESIVNYFSNNEMVIPATAVTDLFIEQFDDPGIGQMIISVNFMAKPQNK